MITTTYWYAWVAIGAAASLAGMIWPFRRGTLGAVANLLLGILGGLLGPFAAIALLGVRPDAPSCLAFATAGALAVLALGHVAWLAWIPHLHRAGRSSRRRRWDH
jgi:hypothetical protein